MNYVLSVSFLSFILTSCLLNSVVICSVLNFVAGNESVQKSHSAGMFPRIRTSKQEKTRYCKHYALSAIIKYIIKFLCKHLMRKIEIFAGESLAV